MNHASEISRPDILPGEHPIEKQDYVIGSRAIDGAYEFVLNLIKNHLPGGMIYGPQRYGKTWAIKYLCQLLKDNFGTTLPVFNFSCQYYKSDLTKGKYFRDLLSDLGHIYASAGVPEDKRDRLIEYLHEKTTLSGQNRLVMIFDDANRLSKHQYEWHVDIYNALERLKDRPHFLLIGQPELIYERSVLKKTKQMQIIGRFMVRDYQFHGLRNADDILICLDMFDGEGDSILDFPHGSGWSFTKFYFTQAWLHGWRLGQYSNLLLNIFIKLRKSVGLSGHFEIPMQYFCATIEFILKEFGDIHIENPQLSEEALAYAIQQSGYIDSELVLEVNAG